MPVIRKDLGNERFGVQGVDCKIVAVGEVVDARRLVDETDIKRIRTSPRLSSQGIEALTGISTEWSNRRAGSPAHAFPTISRGAHAKDTTYFLILLHNPSCA